MASLHIAFQKRHRLWNKASMKDWREERLFFSPPPPMLSLENKETMIPWIYFTSPKVTLHTIFVEVDLTYFQMNREKKGFFKSVCV